MNKIGIVTIYNSNYNFGASLQAYALLHILKEMGAEAKIIDICFDKQKVRERAKAFSFGRIKNAIKRRAFSFYYAKGLKKLKLRCKKFEIFKCNWIEATPTVFKENLSRVLEEFDVYIAGSDQIWNPSYWEKEYFLSFVPDNKRKVSYAASIGVGTYNNEQADFVKQYLKRFYAISVREQEGKDILDSIGIGRNIEVVLDPTLLLDASDWDRLIREVRVPRDYILCCFLGDNAECRLQVKQFARNQKKKLVFLTTSQKELTLNHKVGDVELIDIDPGEFLYIIKYAAYVVTDSFHVTALSILYEREFFVLKRDDDSDSKNMNSRLYSLLKLINLESRLMGKDCQIRPDAIDYKLVNSLIENEKIKSLEYLKAAIGS